MRKVLTLLIVSLVLVSTARAQQTRPFDIAVWSENGEAYNAGITDIRWDTNVVYLAGPNFAIPNVADWNQVKYALTDEPFWCDTNGDGGGDAICSDIATRHATLVQRFNEIKATHPNVKTWVNFSYPEIDRWRAGYADVNDAAFDVVSLDEYLYISSDCSIIWVRNQACQPEWNRIYGRLEFMRTHLLPADARVNNVQQWLGLVPQGFTGMTSASATSWMNQQWMNYALNHVEVQIYAPWPWPSYGGFQGMVTNPTLQSWLKSYHDNDPLWMRYMAFSSSSKYDSWATGQRIFANGSDQHGYGAFDGDNVPTLRYADVDGTGKADVCIRMDSGVQCWLSTGTGWAYSAGYDTNATGQRIMQNEWNPCASSDDFQCYGAWVSPGGWDTIQFADVNGDGKADLCARTNAGVQCWLSTGSGFAYSAAYDTNATGQHILAQIWNPCATYDVDGNCVGAWQLPRGADMVRFADVNGDGKADICAELSCWVSTSAGGWAYQSGYDRANYPGFFDQHGQGVYDGNNSSTIRYPDVNGDGKADACIRNDTGLLCYLSNSSGTGWLAVPGYDTFATGQRIYADYSDQHGYGTFDGDNISTLSFPDVNGDGKADACIRMDYGLVCYLSTGSGFAYSSYYDSWATTPRIFANGSDQHGFGTFDGDNISTLSFPDLNGDGKADACIRMDSGLLCYLSTGNGWLLYSQIYDTYKTGQLIFANGSDQHGYGTFDGDNIPSLSFPDVNGDGRPDACVRNDSGMQCWLNTAPIGFPPVPAPPR